MKRKLSIAWFLLIPAAYACGWVVKMNDWYTTPTQVLTVIYGALLFGYTLFSYLEGKL